MQSAKLARLVMCRRGINGLIPFERNYLNFLSSRSPEDEVTTCIIVPSIFIILRSGNNQRIMPYRPGRQGHFSKAL